MINYILDNNKQPVECNDIQWALWLETADRRVAKTRKGDVGVSTVFLGIDHSWGDGPPLLFETMIFGGEHDKDQWQYSTWDEAEKGHKEACELAGLYPRSIFEYFSAFVKALFT